MKREKGILCYFCGRKALYYGMTDTGRRHFMCEYCKGRHGVGRRGAERIRQ